MASFTTSKSTERQAYRWLMQWARAARKPFLMILFLTILLGLLLLAQAFLLASVLGHGIQSVPVIAMIGLFLARGGVYGLKDYVQQKMAITIQVQLRARLFEALMQASVFTLLRLDRGEVMTTYLEKAEATQAFFSGYLPAMLLAFILPLLIGACVLMTNWIAGTILLLTAPLIPIFMMLVGIGAQHAHQKQFQALSRLSAYFLNLLQGMSTLSRFGLAAQEGVRLDAKTDQFRLKTMQVLKIAFLSSAVLEVFSSVAIAMIAVYLGLALLGHVQFGLSHPVTLTSALFVLLLAPEFYLALRQLAVHYHAKTKAVAAAMSIQPILENQLHSAPSCETMLKTVQPPFFIQVKEMTFQYAPHETLLDRVSFSLSPGECVGIRGPSGCGKSTLLHLLMGLRTPSAGYIDVNGVPLSAYSLEAWHANMAWVGQQTRLFPGTLRENLLIAQPDATTQSMLAALARVQLAALIQRLPDGLDTRVGEANWGFSQGEVQRIALARAMLKQAPLVLLDEPTASLDAHSASCVLAGIDALRSANRTIVLVSHRDDTLLRADRIMVFEGHRLVEQDKVHVALC